MHAMCYSVTGGTSKLIAIDWMHGSDRWQRGLGGRADRNLKP